MGTVVRVDLSTGEVVPRRERFAMAMEGALRVLVRERVLSPMETVVLAGLATMLEWRTNVVAVGGRPLTTEEMADRLGMDASNVRKYVRGLVRKNALGYWRSGEKRAYVMNPELYRKGRVDEAVYLLFEQERRKREREGMRAVRRCGKAMTVVY